MLRQGTGVQNKFVTRYLHDFGTESDYKMNLK